MLFTSSLRKAVDMYPTNAGVISQTAEETHRLLLEKRRKQMIRRHTCSAFIKPAAESVPSLPPPRVVHFNATIEEEEPKPVAPSAPPPPPTSFSAAEPTSSRPYDDWGAAPFVPAGVAAQPAQPAPPAQQFTGHAPSSVYSQQNDDFDDEWTDEDEEQNAHRLSVQDPSAISSHVLNSRASGSRTDLSIAETDSSGPGSKSRNGSIPRPRRISRQDSIRSRRRRSEDQNARRRIEKSVTAPDVPREIENHFKVLIEPNRASAVSSSNYSSVSRRDLSRSHSEHGTDRGSNKVNKSINRFSNFVKSGMEAYVIGESKYSSPPSEKHEIVSINGIIQWKPIQQYYHCIVDKPKKESKLKGLKSFIAYSITSSLTNIQVSRRYKHFDWLHEQLSAKYSMIPIPPLPEKQVAGRYEEDLIDHRKHILQLWVNKICRHPVLSQSEVWLHFISATDEKDWKHGKRRAEKDEYVGGHFFNSITVPQQPLDTRLLDGQVERFLKSVKTSEEAMRVMQERMVIFQKAFAGPVKQNWQKMGAAFKTLQQSFEIDETPSSTKLTDALAQTASQYYDIGQLFDAHTKNDMEPVLESLYSYKGTVQNVPDILHVHKQAVQKFRESEGRLSAAEADKMRQRVDAISYAVLAEIHHQTQEKAEDMKNTMGTYLKKQAAFYQDVAVKLSALSSRMES
ncbi:unnamed protein product [Caenorhabditis bovis]|uniref:PX domain-containing protein n=1 Tax=Caenorhabditis bovis TaxID=2654633 RepID=A0A8S1FBT0_9PELO|nr:unnamed protein product [Caenorhabditis bovis]